ncbi:signal peptidase II [Candidatus Thiothrix anitrata]|nr:signal peptidase II [Candidatus Thiothrix anitrata]
MTLAYNYGAAFSFLGDQDGWQRWFFAILAVAVCGHYYQLVT